MEEIPTFPCFDADATLQQMLFRATRINPTHISNLLDKRRKGKARYVCGRCYMACSSREPLLKGEDGVPIMGLLYFQCIRGNMHVYWKQKCHFEQLGLISL